MLWALCLEQEMQAVVMQAQPAVQTAVSMGPCQEVQAETPTKVVMATTEDPCLALITRSTAAWCLLLPLRMTLGCTEVPATISTKNLLWLNLIHITATWCSPQ